MAKMPFRGIAQIVTAKEPQALAKTASTTVAAQHVPAEVQPGLRPIGFDAVENDSRSLGARVARWWSAAKRFLLALSG